MPDLRNEPPESDHDRVVALTGTVARLERDVDGLRTWRHDSVAPAIMAIQAQQKTTDSAVARLAVHVDKFVIAIGALVNLPVDFRAHMDDDQDSFRALQAGISGLADKMDENRAERAKQHSKLIYWVAGFLIAGLAALTAAQWALISPHLQWH